MLVFGTFIFNEIFVLPIFGFNLYTRAALAQQIPEEKGNSSTEKEALINKSKANSAAVQGQSETKKKPLRADTQSDSD